MYKRQIQRIDAGIMPLPDTPFERGKCGYKLIQYMACAKPVLASPVGVNDLIVRSNVGFLVNDGGWAEAIERMARLSRDERRVMGTAARDRVETEFSTRVTAPRLAAALTEAKR